MAYLVVLALTLSLAVRYWPGQPPAQWIGTWIDRLWLLIGVTFAVGLFLAFFTVTTTPLPGGGTRHVWSVPREVWYAIAGLGVPLAMLSVLGALHIARSEVRAFSPDAVRAWATGGRLRRIGFRLVVAFAAAGVLWCLGEPLALNSNSGDADVLAFAIGLIAIIVLLTALASAWRSARTP
jgi:hypothetical protein